MKKRWDAIKRELSKAFFTPTIKQKEAYGRFFLTPSAVSIVAALTMLFAEKLGSFYVVVRVCLLVFCTVVAFVIGAIFSKGE